MVAYEPHVGCSGGGLHTCLNSLEIGCPAILGYQKVGPYWSTGHFFVHHLGDALLNDYRIH